MIAMERAFSVRNDTASKVLTILLTVMPSTQLAVASTISATR